MECKTERNLRHCTCTYPCGNHGRCCDCVAYHRDRNEVPACFFSEKAERTYDRSIEKLCDDRIK